MPHSCRAGVMAFLNRWSTTAQERCLWPGQQRRELPTKSSPIRGPGREQWAKCRVSQTSFTQQLAENQQVSMDRTTHRQQEGNLATMRRRWRTRRQMIKINRTMTVWSQTSFVGFVAAPVWHLSTSIIQSHFWMDFFVCFDSDNAQVTSDVSHSVEECARRRDGWTDLRVRNWKFAILARS